MAFGLLQQINWPLRCDRAGSVQDCGGQEGCEGQSCRVSGRAGEPVEGSDRSKIDLIAISRHWACPHARVGSLSVSRRAPPGAPSAWFRTDFRSESLTRPLRALARCTTLNTVFPYKVAAAWKAEAGIPARSFFFHQHVVQTQPAESRNRSAEAGRYPDEGAGSCSRHMLLPALSHSIIPCLGCRACSCSPVLICGGPAGALCPSSPLYLLREHGAGAICT